MREHPAITVKKIAEQLKLSVGGVRYHVNKMKKDGVVEHIGSSKKGTWFITKNNGVCVQTSGKRVMNEVLQ